MRARLEADTQDIEARIKMDVQKFEIRLDESSKWMEEDIKDEECWQGR